MYAYLLHHELLGHEKYLLAVIKMRKHDLKQQGSIGGEADHPVVPEVLLLEDRCRT